VEIPRFRLGGATLNPLIIKDLRKSNNRKR